MSHPIRRAVLGLLLAWPFALAAQGFLGAISDPKPPVEPKVPAALPAVAGTQPVELPIDGPGSNRYFVDAASLAVDEERLVRYALTVRAAGGARNVSYEAIRCDTREMKLLALGRADDTWSVLANPVWRPIRSDLLVNRHHIELFTRLCEGGSAASPRIDRLVARLRQAATIGP